MADYTLPQGTELDALWHEKALGKCAHHLQRYAKDNRDSTQDYTVYRCSKCKEVFSGLAYHQGMRICPPVSSSIAAARLVKAEMIRRGYSCVVEHERGKVTTTFFGPGKTCGSSCAVDGNAEADEARCIVCAALDAVHNAGEVPGNG